MTYTKAEREEYNETRRKNCTRLNITKNQYNWLRRKGQALHKFYEDNCNGVFQAEGDYDKAVDPLYKAVETYVKKLGLHVYFQTDPRGATIYLDKEPLTDSAYNRGTCIY